MYNRLLEETNSSITIDTWDQFNKLLVANFYSDFRESCNIDDTHVCACLSQQYKFGINFVIAHAQSAVASLRLMVGCCKIP